MSYLFKWLNQYSESELPLGLTFTKSGCLNRLASHVLDSLLLKYNKGYSYCCITINPDPGLDLGKTKLTRYYRDLTVEGQRELIKRRLEMYYNMYESKFKIDKMYNYFELTKQGNVHVHSCLIFKTPTKHEQIFNSYVEKQTMKYFHHHLGRPKVPANVCCSISKTSSISDDLEGLTAWIEYITKEDALLAPYNITRYTSGILKLLKKHIRDNNNVFMDEDDYNLILDLQDVDYNGIETLLK